MLYRLIFGYNPDGYGTLYFYRQEKSILIFQLHQLFIYTGKTFTENNVPTQIPTHINDIPLE